MKFAEINAIYTKTVTEWLSKGYTINTATMSGSQGEITKIDLTDGKEIIRIMLGNFNEGFYNQGIEILVGRSLEERVKPNSSDTWGTIWFRNLEVISSQKFYQIAECRDGEKNYGTKEDAEAALNTRMTRRAARECEPSTLYDADKAKEIARRYIARKTGSTRIQTSLIKVNKDCGTYRIYYRNDTYRLH